MRWTTWMLAGALVATVTGCSLGGAPRSDAEDGGGFEVRMSDAEWRARLTPEQYRVLREKGTERAFDNPYWDHREAGVYRCAGCGQALFRSDDKYASGTGWPSFTRPISGATATSEDRTLWMVRTEVHCSRCGGHLGHVFGDGPTTRAEAGPTAAPTGRRYCMNSAALAFAAHDAD